MVCPLFCRLNSIFYRTPINYNIIYIYTYQPPKKRKQQMLRVACCVFDFLLPYLYPKIARGDRPDRPPVRFWASRNTQHATSWFFILSHWGLTHGDYSNCFRNSLMVMMLSFGQSMCLRMSKWVSLVTMYSASAATAQSTNLLSSASASISPKW